MREISSEKEQKRIPLFVLDNFIRFERKFYQVFGVSIGRPIKAKTLVYFIVTLLILIGLYIMPGIGIIIKKIPVGVLITIPIGAAWFLSDIGTEDRSPVKFFRSFILHNYRKLIGKSYYRGRKLPKQKDYTIGGYTNYISTNADDIIMTEYTAAENKVKKESEESINYIKSVINRSKKAEVETNEEDKINTPITVIDDEEVNNEVEEIPEQKKIKVGKTQKKEKLALIKKENKLAKKENKSAKKESKKNKVKKKRAVSALMIGLMTILLGSTVLFVTNIYNSSADATVGNPKEEVEDDLALGLESASTENYEKAVSHFDKVKFDEIKFDELAQLDKETILLSYLFTDQADYTLELDPNFDEVVISYYRAKEDLEHLRKLVNYSDDIKFEIASYDENYQDMIHLKDKVTMNVEIEEDIVNAYLKLNKIDEALVFVDGIKENESLIKTIDSFKEDKDVKK